MQAHFSIFAFTVYGSGVFSRFQEMFTHSGILQIFFALFSSSNLMESNNRSSALMTCKLIFFILYMIRLLLQTSACRGPSSQHRMLTRLCFLQGVITAHLSKRVVEGLILFWAFYSVRLVYIDVDFILIVTALQSFLKSDVLMRFCCCFV